MRTTFLWFEREWAEAGAVLQSIKNTEAKCGIAVKRERARQSTAAHIKKTPKLQGAFLLLKKGAFLTNAHKMLTVFV